VKFKDGGAFAEIIVEYPIGHRRRRADGVPLLLAKFRKNLARRFPEAQQQGILGASLDAGLLASMAVSDYVDLYAGDL
jgi:2-methylcitrate dehydratase